MNVSRLRHSVENIAHFARRAPFAFYRNTVGRRYLSAHPELARIYVRPRPDIVLEQIASTWPTLEVRRIPADADRLRKWVHDARYPFLAYHVSSTEKFLEHEISVELLGSRKSGLFIDVASCRSYFPELMRKRGFQVIVQDLVYEQGLHGNLLGCDAAHMPLPDSSVDAMTLHCSFEHFEGSADIDFIRECGRLLAPGGIAVILPLYLHEQQITWVDPYYLAKAAAQNEAGATWQPSIGYGNSFGRMYTAATFKDRILPALNETRLRPTLWVVDNVDAVDRQCYLKFAFTLEQA